MQPTKIKALRFFVIDDTEKRVEVMVVDNYCYSF